MKTALIPIVLSLGLLACGQHAHNKTTKDYSLPPKGRVKVAFKAEHETQISFITNLSGEQKSRCQNECVRLVSLDANGEGEAVRSPTSASLTARPRGGKISVTLENLESFPIKVRLSWQ